MGGGRMSAGAAYVRSTIAPEVVDPGWNVEDERQQWESAAAGTPLASGTSDRSDHVDGVPCRWVSPANAEQPGTVIVYGHGGGLVSGSSVTHREFASRLALATACPVLIVDYRRLPEHHPVDAISDVVRVHRHLARTARTGRVVFAGDSSGAALMLAALVALRDEGAPLPAGLISFSGAFDATLSSPSIDGASDPQLRRDVLEQWQRLIATVIAPDDPRISPVYGDLHGLPPVLLLAGGDEAWRDDSIRLAQRIADCGGSVELVIRSGMWHVWPMWGSFPEAEDAVACAAAFVHTGCS